MVVCSFKTYRGSPGHALLTVALVCSACGASGAPKNETTEASGGDDGGPVSSGFTPSFDDGADEDSSADLGEDSEASESDMEGSDSESEGETDEDAGNDTSDIDCSDDSITFSLLDEHNYRFRAEFAVTHRVLAARSNFTVDWSDLEHDLRGRPIETGGPIKTVELTLWNLNEYELLRGLNTGTLTQKDLEAIITAYPAPGEQQAELLDFTSFGTEVDPEVLLSYMDPAEFDPETHTYMVGVNASDTAAEQIRMLQLFSLDEDAEELQLAITDDSAEAEIEIDLEHGSELGVPTGNAIYEIDYAQLTETGDGQPLEVSELARARIGRFEQSFSELSANALELEELAIGMWELKLEEGAFIPAEGKSKDDAEFPGIDSRDTWLLSLEYRNTGSPLPPVLTRLVPCR